MFCTTECWDCEDKNCKHYISKSSLYFENVRLKEQIKEYEKIIEEYSKEAQEREEQERLNYLCEQEEVFNDYSFMEGDETFEDIV